MATNANNDKEKAYLYSILSNKIGFYLYGDEYQQAVLRVFILAIVIYPIFTLTNKLSGLVLFYIIGYSISALLILLHTRIYPNLNYPRLLIAMFLDVMGANLSLYFTNDIGAIFMGAYLWFIIGYGFRFGRNMLIATYISSLIGFTIASMLSPYWQNHIESFFGLLFTLFTIPIYALILLNRLKTATKKAEAASRAKSEFLSHISHEIRTPLNGIVGACNLLESSNLNSSNQTMFNVVKSSSNLLLELVNNVLDLSKIESGKIITHQEDFNIQELLLNTINLFETQCTQKNLSIAYSIEKNTPLRVHGNLLHAKQVLVNLVGNAVKFTQEGSIKVHVSSQEKTNTHAFVKFEVIDTGIGIAKESLPHLFESFVQAEESIKYQFGGTGLGTTISKKLVEIMHGEIGVESELGKGSRFWFEIPLERLSTEPAKEENIASEIIPFKKAESNAKKRTYRILVAEDNDTNILIISQMLALANHKFDIVKNGQLALEKLRHNEYDLMLLDYHMPVMGGLEALKIYQAINIGAMQIPAIVLTADATDTTKQNFENLKVAGFLTKPLRIEELSRGIEEVMQKSTNKSAEVVQYEEIKKQDMPSTDVLDTNRLNDLAKMSKNQNFVKNLLQGFIGDTDLNIAKLKGYVKDRDYASMNDCGHTIAGSAYNIGAIGLANKCRIINHIKPTDTENIDVLLAETMEIYGMTKIALATYLESESRKQLQQMI